MAVAGPERSGSGTGVPVPRRTTFVRLTPTFGAWLAGCWGVAVIATSSRAERHMIRMSFMASSIVGNRTTGAVPPYSAVLRNSGRPKLGKFFAVSGLFPSDGHPEVIPVQNFPTKSRWDDSLCDRNER